MKDKPTQSKPKAAVNAGRSPRSRAARGSTAPIHDIEIAAIGTVLKSLKPLDYKARDRVIEYAAAWCKDPAREPGQ